MKRSRIVRVFNLALAGLLIAVVIMNLWLIWRKQTSNEKLPKVFGFAGTVVVSGSMEPAIKAGDFLIVRQRPGYSVGDIITFETGQSLVTHRIVSIQEGQVITRGDYNNVDDAPIEFSQIAGKVVLRLPRAGMLVLFLKQPSGMLLLAILGIGMIEISYRRSRSGSEKRASDQ